MAPVPAPRNAHMPIARAFDWLMPTSPDRPYPPGDRGTRTRGSIANRRANMTPRRGAVRRPGGRDPRCAYPLSPFDRIVGTCSPAAPLVRVVREQREQGPPCSGRSTITRAKTFASVPVPCRNATTDYPHREPFIRKSVLGSFIDPGEKWTHCHNVSLRAAVRSRRHGHLLNPSPKTCCSVRQRRCARRGRR